MSEVLEVPKKILKPVTNLLGFKTPEVPDTIINMPAPDVAKEPLPTMPSPDDAKVKAARRRSIAEQRRRRGRASTLLSQETDALGG